MDAPQRTVWHYNAAGSPIILSLLAMGMLPAGGCGGTGASHATTNARQISPMDFSTGESVSDATRVPPADTQATAEPPRVISAQEARGGDPDVLTLVGRPADLRSPEGESSASGDRLPRTEDRGSESIPLAPDNRTTARSDSAGQTVVDEMVGQINGRPVYAAQFLQSLDDILRAEAIEKDRDQWIQTAGQLIQNQLLERIRDELLIAEFNADLTYEERIGLFSFIEQIQQGIVDRDLGSAARADERLRTQENVSLRGKAEAQFNREIVFEQLRREVTRKVQVSWRDIRRYYEQNIEIFQPPSSARLRVLRVDPAERGVVERLLEQANDRAELISERTTFRRTDGGVIELELGPDGLAGAEFFGPPELNEPATQLEPGMISEPVEFAGAVWWLWLEEVVQPEAISLYDAQNRIEQAIRSEREQQERSRYFQRLFGSSTMTEQQLGEMRDRLIDFAIDRYLGPAEVSGAG